MHSEKGCPEYLKCSAANLLEIEQDKVAVTKKRDKLVLPRREAASPPALSHMDVLLESKRGDSRDPTAIKKGNPFSVRKGKTGGGTAAL